MWSDEQGGQGAGGGPLGPGLEEKFGKYAEGKSIGVGYRKGDFPR